ncbi:MAG: hypothetical protein PHI79_04610 [Sulfurovaceae bacterium]|nr:hypothetical protein [Sulfurovaceae bacterium]
MSCDNKNIDKKEYEMSRPALFALSYISNRYSLAAIYYLFG